MPWDTVVVRRCVFAADRLLLMATAMILLASTRVVVATAVSYTMDQLPGLQGDCGNGYQWLPNVTAVVDLTVVGNVVGNQSNCSITIGDPGSCSAANTSSQQWAASSLAITVGPGSVSDVRICGVVSLTSLSLDGAVAIATVGNVRVTSTLSMVATDNVTVRDSVITFSSPSSVTPVVVQCNATLLSGVSRGAFNVVWSNTSVTASATPTSALASAYALAIDYGVCTTSTLTLANSTVAITGSIGDASTRTQIGGVWFGTSANPPLLNRATFTLFGNSVVSNYAAVNDTTAVIAYGVTIQVGSSDVLLDLRQCDVTATVSRWMSIASVASPLHITGGNLHDGSVLHTNTVLADGGVNTTALWANFSSVLGSLVVTNNTWGTTVNNTDATAFSLAVMSFSAQSSLTFSGNSFNHTALVLPLTRTLATPNRSAAGVYVTLNSAAATNTTGTMSFVNNDCGFTNICLTITTSISCFSTVMFDNNTLRCAGLALRILYPSMPALPKLAEIYLRGNYMTSSMLCFASYYLLSASHAYPDVTSVIARNNTIDTPRGNWSLIAALVQACSLPTLCFTGGLSLFDVTGNTVVAATTLSVNLVTGAYFNLTVDTLRAVGNNVTVVANGNVRTAEGLLYFVLLNVTQLQIVGNTIVTSGNALSAAGFQVDNLFLRGGVANDAVTVTDNVFTLTAVSRTVGFGIGNVMGDSIVGSFVMQRNVVTLQSTVRAGISLVSKVTTGTPVSFGNFTLSDNQVTSTPLAPPNSGTSPTQGTACISIQLNGFFVNATVLASNNVLNEGGSFSGQSTVLLIFFVNRWVNSTAVLSGNTAVLTDTVTAVSPGSAGNGVGISLTGCFTNGTGRVVNNTVVMVSQRVLVGLQMGNFGDVGQPAVDPYAGSPCNTTVVSSSFVNVTSTANAGVGVSAIDLGTGNSPTFVAPLNTRVTNVTSFATAASTAAAFAVAVSDNRNNHKRGIQSVTFDRCNGTSMQTTALAPLPSGIVVAQAQQQQYAPALTVTNCTGVVYNLQTSNTSVVTLVGFSSEDGDITIKDNAFVAVQAADMNGTASLLTVYTSILSSNTLYLQRNRLTVQSVTPPSAVVLVYLNASLVRATGAVTVGANEVVTTSTSALYPAPTFTGVYSRDVQVIATAASVPLTLLTPAGGSVFQCGNKLNGRQLQKSDAVSSYESRSVWAVFTTQRWQQCTRTVSSSPHKTGSQSASARRTTSWSTSKHANSSTPSFSDERTSTKTKGTITASRVRGNTTSASASHVTPSGSGTVTWSLSVRRSGTTTASGAPTVTMTQSDSYADNTTTVSVTPTHTVTPGRNVSRTFTKTSPRSQTRSPFTLSRSDTPMSTFGTSTGSHSLPSSMSKSASITNGSSMTHTVTPPPLQTRTRSESDARTATVTPSHQRPPTRTRTATSEVEQPRCNGTMTFNVTVSPNGWLDARTLQTAPTRLDITPLIQTVGLHGSVDEEVCASCFTSAAPSSLVVQACDASSNIIVDPVAGLAARWPTMLSSVTLTSTGTLRLVLQPDAGVTVLSAQWVRLWFSALAFRCDGDGLGVVLQVAPYVPDVVNQATQASTASGAVAVAGALVGSGAAGDAQSLAILGLISCGSPSGASSARGAAFMVAPVEMGKSFGLNDDEGGAVGNLVLLASFAAVQLLLAAIVKDLMQRRDGTSSWRAAFAIVRFPSVTLMAVSYAVPGTLLLALKSLWANGISGPALLAVALSLGAPPLMWYVAKRSAGAISFGDANPDALRFYTFANYGRVLHEYAPPGAGWRQWLVRQVLPVGHWGPQEPKRRAGSVVGLYRQVWAVFMAPMPLIEAVLFSIVASVPTPARSTLCVLQFALLALIRFGFALLLAVTRPYRTPAVALLRLVASAVVFTAIVTSASLAAQPTPASPQGIQVLAAASSLIAVSTALQVALSLWQRWLESCGPLKMNSNDPNIYAEAYFERSGPLRTDATVRKPLLLLAEELMPTPVWDRDRPERSEAFEL